MTVKEQIAALEKRFINYKNNYDFAVKQNNKIRQTKYKNIMAEVKEQIKQLEREIPIESNERLREIIDGQNEAITKLQEVNKNQNEKIKALEQRIEDFINPPKKEEAKEEPAIYECPKCGRGGFKGVTGVKIHQASGACKAAH